MSNANKEFLQPSSDWLIKPSFGETALRNATLVTSMACAAFLSYSAAQGALDTIKTFYSTEAEAAQQKEAAADFSNPEVAVVAFDINTVDTIILAKDIETALETTAHDFIDIDMTIVEPNNDALAMYEASTEMGCIDAVKPKHLTSYLAKEAMPELAKYDKVLTLNAAPVCDPALGRAFGVLGDTADVYNVSNELNSNGDLKTSNLFKAPDADAMITTGVAVHEMLHLFGLGHSGILTPSEEDSTESESGLFVFTENAATISVDIAAIAKKNSYNEYGDTGIMGSSVYSPQHYELSVVQKYGLDWANRALGDSTVIQVKEPKHGVMTFEEGDRDTSIGIIELKTPVTVKNDTLERPFDKVAIVPSSCTNDQAVACATNPYKAELYLMNDKNDSIRLGELANVGESDITYDLTVEHQHIVVEMSYSTGQVIVKETL